MSEWLPFDAAVARTKTQTPQLDEAHIARLLMGVIADNRVEARMIIDADVPRTPQEYYIQERQFLAKYLASGRADLPPLSPYETFPYNVEITKTSLDAWARGLFGEAPALGKASPHRPKGRSMEAADMPVVIRMREMVDNGLATGPFDAATQILRAEPSIVPGADFDSTRRRLKGRYSKLYGE